MENKFCIRYIRNIHLLADTAYIRMMMTWVTFLMLCINNFITIITGLNRHLMSSLNKRKQQCPVNLNNTKKLLATCSFLFSSHILHLKVLVQCNYHEISYKFERNCHSDWWNNKNENYSVICYFSRKKESKGQCRSRSHIPYP